MEILVLIVTFIILIGIGVPVAWSIGLSSLFTLFISIPFIPSVTTVAQRMATGIDSFTLLAIPFFVLAGPEYAAPGRTPTPACRLDRARATTLCTQVARA